MAVFAWADLHGRLDIFKKGLKHLNPEDKIYFLGDAADRGPDGWEIIKMILNDDRFVYIKGNHEDLLVKAIKSLGIKEAFDPDAINWNKNMDLWFYNGGEPTYSAMLIDKIPVEEKINIIDKLDSLPFVACYYNAKLQNVLLSHAGCDDCTTADSWDEEKFLWDRDHLMFYDVWTGESNEIIVHGHTPIELMIEEQAHNIEWYSHLYKKESNLYDTKLIEPKFWKGTGAYWYGKNHKVNIDTGATWNGHSVLLNLDTWEETIITVYT